MTTNRFTKPPQTENMNISNKVTPKEKKKTLSNASPGPPGNLPGTALALPRTPPGPSGPQQNSQDLQRTPKGLLVCSFPIGDEQCVLHWPKLTTRNGHGWKLKGSSNLSQRCYSRIGCCALQKGLIVFGGHRAGGRKKKSSSSYAIFCLKGPHRKP